MRRCLHHSSRSARSGSLAKKSCSLGLEITSYLVDGLVQRPLKQAQRLRVAIEARIKELREGRLENTPLPAEQLIAPAPPPEIDQSDLFEAAQKRSGSFIEVGDIVSIRYLTGMRSFLTVTLSDKKNDPSNGIVHASESLGTALLGAEEGDEIEVLVGSIIRRAVIDRVEKTGEKRPQERAQTPSGPELSQPHVSNNAPNEQRNEAG